MKKQDGIALIATLLIMAAIMALGVGTMFLSTMNLKIAENSRTHAVARYNAEAGMEAAIVKLKKDYETSNPKQFPDTLTLPTSPDTNTVKYEDIGTEPEDSKYTTYPNTTTGIRTQARVVIVGTGPNNARYQTEALFAAAASTSSTPPVPKGLTSEDVTTANGGPTLIDAQVHGNGGYDLSGSPTFQKCEGTICTAVSVSDMPVTAAPGMSRYVCRANGGASALCSSERPTKYTPAPVSIGDISKRYLDLRNGTEMSPSKFGVSSADTIDSTNPLVGCTNTVAATTTRKGKKTETIPAQLSTTYPAGSTVCVTGDAEIPDGANYSDIKIIVKGNATVEGAATFDNTNLLSMNTLNLSARSTVTMSSDSRLFGDLEVNFEGSISYSGSATIASGGDMNFTNKATDISNSQSNEVGLALMSVGNFDGKGGLKGKNDEYLNAAIWVGGTFAANGGAKIRGGIASKGSLSIAGSSEIYGDAVFTNPDLFEQTMEVTSLSRR